MDNNTFDKYLIIQYYDAEDGFDNSVHIITHTHKHLMTHARAVDEYSRLCEYHPDTKFAIYKMYEH